MGQLFGSGRGGYSDTKCNDQHVASSFAIVVPYLGFWLRRETGSWFAQILCSVVIKVVSGAFGHSYMFPCSEYKNDYWPALVLKFRFGHISCTAPVTLLCFMCRPYNKHSMVLG